MTLAAVLFDAGNTLIHAHPGRLAEIFRAEGIDLDESSVLAAELEARRCLHDAIVQGHAGTEPEVWHEYFVRLFRSCGVPDEGMEAVGRRVREVHAAEHLWTAVAPGAEAALTALARAGFRLGVVSNADGRMAEVLERCGLGGYFEFVVDSEVVGFEKPHPEIFHEGCRRLGLPPASCLYVGDLYPVDYVGALDAGLRAVLVDPLGVHGETARTVASLVELPGFVAALGPSAPSG